MSTSISKQTNVRLPNEINLRLEKLSSRTGRTKAFYIRQALEAHLEDLEDIYEADKIYQRILNGERTYSLDEVEQELGLGN